MLNYLLLTKLVIFFMKSQFTNINIMNELFFVN